MSETKVIKPIRESDINRMRNLITGKFGNKSTQGIGYTKQQQFHEEGEEWEEDGRTWTMINGLKQNKTKLDKAKELVTLPLFCPQCKKIMNHKMDKLFFIQANRCFDCQINFEAEIKLLGLWDEYEKNIINQDIDSMTKDFEIWFNESLNETNDSYISENGDIENWIGTAKTKLIQNKEETIKYLQSLKK